MDSHNKIINAAWDLEYFVRNLECVIRGTASPCETCIGCEVEDSRMGQCNSFIFNEQRAIEKAAREK